MKPFVNEHFLSLRDNLRFVIFVAAALLLVIIGSLNKDKALQVLPTQNQLIDSKPKQSEIPGVNKPGLEKSEIKRG